MTNTELDHRLRALTRQERNTTAEILRLIREAERRKLHAEKGYASVFDWLVNEFCYSQAAAYRRIQAARLVELLPETMDRLRIGRLNLSHLSQAESVFKREEKRTGRKIAAETKREVLEQIENTTMEATLRILKQRFPECPRNKDTLRRISETESRLSAIVDEPAREDLLRIREVTSHAHPGATWGKLIGVVASHYLAAKDPLRKLTRPVTATANHRVMTPALRAMVLQRAGGRCEFCDPRTGKRCGSRHFLEVDHIHPRALGGSNDPKNLRALCRTHNQLEADRILGAR